MNTSKAERFFETVRPSTVKRYTDYWETIRPKTNDDFLRRYLFAFTSVHTSWKGNINGFNAIKDLGWLGDKENLRERLINSRCGMHNARTGYIWDFTEKFYANPLKYTKVQGDWTSYRNKLVEEINGIGMAKVSFTLEMCFPSEVEVTCIDTHGIQMYDLPFVGWKSKKEVECYEKTEKHWVECSKALNASPYITRSMFWDKKQNRRNTRYWSYVLEA